MSTLTNWIIHVHTTMDRPLFVKRPSTLTRDLSLSDGPFTFDGSSTFGTVHFRNRPLSPRLTYPTFSTLQHENQSAIFKISVELYDANLNS